MSSEVPQGLFTGPWVWGGQWCSRPRAVRAPCCLPISLQTAVPFIPFPTCLLLSPTPAPQHPWASSLPPPLIISCPSLSSAPLPLPWACGGGGRSLLIDVLRAGTAAPDGSHVLPLRPDSEPSQNGRSGGPGSGANSSAARSSLPPASLSLSHPLCPFSCFSLCASVCVSKSLPAFSPWKLILNLTSSKWLQTGGESHRPGICVRWFLPLGQAGWPLQPGKVQPPMTCLPCPAGPEPCRAEEGAGHAPRPTIRGPYDSGRSPKMRTGHPTRA